MITRRELMGAFALTTVGPTRKTGPKAPGATRPQQVPDRQERAYLSDIGFTFPLQGVRGIGKEEAKAIITPFVEGRKLLINEIRTPGFEYAIQVGWENSAEIVSAAFVHLRGGLSDVTIDYSPLRGTPERKQYFSRAKQLAKGIEHAVNQNAAPRTGAASFRCQFPLDPRRPPTVRESEKLMAEYAFNNYHLTLLPQDRPAEELGPKYASRIRVFAPDRTMDEYVLSIVNLPERHAVSINCQFMGPFVRLRERERDLFERAAKIHDYLLARTR